MKKIITVLMAALMILSLFAGCSKDMSRQNYNYNTKKLVQLDSYAVEVDSSADTYKEAYAEKAEDLLNAKLTKGEIKKGDTANIDYVGKKDGVAFEGGTAEGHDLVIGSNSFIPGFEEGLIGAAIGSTVDLNLTFPKEYQNAELAGKAVVFTVKINYAVRKFEEINDENAKFCGFKNATDMEAECATYAKECVAWEEVCKKAVIETYPEKEDKKFVEFYFVNLEQMLMSNYGMTVENYLSYTGNTKESIESQFVASEQFTGMRKNYLLAYYVLDCEGVKVNAEMVDTFVKESGITATSLSRDYLEIVAVLEKAIVLVGEKATIK